MLHYFKKKVSRLSFRITEGKATRDLRKDKQKEYKKNRE